MTPSDLEAVFELRQATRENRVSLQELEEGYGITREGLAHDMRSHVRGWLAEDERRVVGFAMGDASTGEVQVVAVHPDYEDRGLGKALLARVIDWLFAQKHAEVWLRANPDPTLRAFGFYRKLGWQRTGEVRGSEEILRLSRSAPDLPWRSQI
ncbi:GNAT family N-acetyltransferase [Algihabitans sp.]|uniref:GNAT family N-acetyltransferase n=1 Tax=Algihabitans sp. TaxID=2821514 RepID=UPI003BA84399